jgi:endoglucanase
LAPWPAYKARFVAPEGRVVDTGNGGISHSEGQGFAMLLAVHHGDQATFDQLWGWTKKHLQTRGDRLLSWKWQPGVGVADRNNASDGDVLAAWALARAAAKWREPAYKAEALGLAGDLLKRCVITHGDLTVLLPGADGFAKPEGPIVNLSYYVFPAFDELTAVTGRPGFRDLALAGVKLTKRARLGKRKLPADWVQLQEKQVVPAPEHEARFSYDAVRVPLYLMWGARPASLLAPFKAAWTPVAAAPAWFALDGGKDAGYKLTPGLRAIADAAVAYPALPAVPPAPDDKADYYDASLSLLARVMRDERGKR